jgi:hypothetical protein
MNGIMTAAVPLCHFCLGLRNILGQGWLTYGTRHSLLSQFFFIYFARLYVNIYTPDGVEIANELLLLANNAASETYLHKSGEV